MTSKRNKWWMSLVHRSVVCGNNIMKKGGGGVGKESELMHLPKAATIYFIPAALSLHLISHREWQRAREFSSLKLAPKET